MLGLVGRARAAKDPWVSEARAKLPWVGVIIGLVAIVAAPAVGSVLGPGWSEALASSVTGDLILTDARDPWAARAYAIAALTILAAVPGVACVVWLVASVRRSLAMACLFAGVSSLFGAVGVMRAGSMHRAMLQSVAVIGSDPLSEGAVQFTLVSVVSSGVRLALGLGLCGATVGAVAVAAAASAKGLRVALWATVGLPLGAAVFAALCTPPDVGSTLIFMGSVVLCWLLALGFGAAVGVWRQRSAERG